MEEIDTIAYTASYEAIIEKINEIIKLLNTLEADFRRIETLVEMDLED